MSAELLSVAKLKKLSSSLDFFDCLQEAVYSFEEYEDEVGQQFYEDAIAQNRWVKLLKSNVDLSGASKLS